MRKFGTWIGRYFLRPKYSFLWWMAGVTYGLSYIHIGMWAVLWLVLSALPITALEVWWNDYADDYSDLADDTGEGK